jgi:hypothetical protein
MSKIKLGAIALALSLSAALPVDVPYAGGLFGVPTAQAGVLSTIKSGAKKVGSAAKVVPPPRSAATPPPRSPSLPKPPTYDPPKPSPYEPKPPTYEPKPSPYGLKSTDRALAQGSTRDLKPMRPSMSRKGR